MRQGSARPILEKTPGAALAGGGLRGGKLMTSAPSGAVSYDIVVIGTSAGGIDALKRLVARLPRDLPAAIFVVQHVAPDFPSALPQILTQAGPLPAAHALDGEPIQPGHIYVAPPDDHLTPTDGRVQVRKGPKEHGWRPAIDLLFRSAARVYGPRVVGVILSGLRDDGIAGLIAVKLRGGTTMVQDPAEAEYPAMHCVTWRSTTACRSTKSPRCWCAWPAHRLP
jgi:two-component system, chemotaxis family, protein-glutamate methylesterase/glutaminase